MHTAICDCDRRTINAVKFYLTLLVVIIHCRAGFGIRGRVSDIVWTNLNLSDIYNITNMAIAYIMDAAVPLFFLISGYLFFANICDFSYQTYLIKIKKRVFTLFLPYLIWNFIAFISYCLLKYNIYSISYVLENGVLDLFWNTSLKGNYPVLVPLWYVRNLMLLCLLTPFIFAYIKKLKIYGIAILPLVCFTGIIKFPYWLRSDDLFFFALGAYAAIDNKDFCLFFESKYKNLLLSLLLFLLTLVLDSLGIEYSFFIQRLFWLSTLPCILIFAKKTITNNSVEASLNMFIYLFHNIFPVILFAPITKKVIAWLGNTWYYEMCCFWVYVTMCVASCIIAYYILNILVPNSLKFLLGNR